MKKINKVDLTSKDIKEEQREKLRQFFPEVFSEEKIDFEKLKLALGESVDIGRERYGMNWPGKAQAIKVAQVPSTATLKPDEKASVDFDTTQNIFIEGDNLEVLKLLQKSYFGKIKMIYLDPPYNTGKEFIYPDKYEEGLQTYLQYTGQMDVEGKKFSTNVETDGRFHSKWMNMMWPRLFLARNLLKEDGVIFISIDDSESVNLKKICDEVFGEENFVAQIVWQNKEGGGGSDSRLFKIKHEYVFCYAKTIDSLNIQGIKPTNEERYTESDKYEGTRGKYLLIKLESGSLGYIKSLDYPILGPDGSEIHPNQDDRKIKRWRWSKNKVEWGIKNDYVVIKKDQNNNWGVYTKQYLNADNEGNIVERRQNPVAVIDEFSTTQSAKQLTELFGKRIFDYPKPVELIEWLTDRIIFETNDIVMDFFAGSATTAHAVMLSNAEDNGNRRFILTQLPESTPEDSEACKAGYKDITEIGKERIRRAGKKILEDYKDNEKFDAKKFDKGFKVFKLDKSNFSVWDGSSGGDIQKKLELHVDNVDQKSNEKDILYEILVKAGFELSEKVEEIEINNKKVYSIQNSQLLICLDNKLDKDFVKNLVEKKSKQFICLNSSFKDDADLTNTAKILENNQIEFRII